MKMSKLGDPRRLTVWLSSWFIDRTARVRVNGFVGPSRTFKEGQPQSSVLFPLLFTMYVIDHLTEFKKDTFVNAYADDLLTAHSARNKDNQK